MTGTVGGQRAGEGVRGVVHYVTVLAVPRIPLSTEEPLRKGASVNVWREDLIPGLADAAHLVPAQAARIAHHQAGGVEHIEIDKEPVRIHAIR